MSGTLTTTTVEGESRFWMPLFCRRCGGAVLIEHNAANVSTPQIIRTLPTGEELSVRGLPADVEHYYMDAIKVLQAGVPEAAAVQLRRTLEAAAAHFKVKPFPLVGAVKELIKQGLITTQFGEVLGHIREVGNIGAHATDKRVEMATAQRALRFTTQVLRNLFEIPAELRELGSAPDEAVGEDPSDKAADQPAG
jgi:hypothetical protein